MHFLSYFLEHVMEETSANIFNVIETLQEKFIILSGKWLIFQQRIIIPNELLRFLAPLQLYNMCFLVGHDSYCVACYSSLVNYQNKKGKIT